MKFYLLGKLQINQIITLTNAELQIRQVYRKESYSVTRQSKTRRPSEALVAQVCSSSYLGG
jgi:hypothetical protein